MILWLQPMPFIIFTISDLQLTPHSSFFEQRHRRGRVVGSRNVTLVLSPPRSWDEDPLDQSFLSKKLETKILGIKFEQSSSISHQSQLEERIRAASLSSRNTRKVDPSVKPDQWQLEASGSERQV